MKAASNKAAIRSDVKVGDLVWIADRRNGRITENLGRVHLINKDGSLGLVYKDQGADRLIMFCHEWKSGAELGWWKAG